MIRLHDYWRSSASYRLRIALELAGLDHNRLAVDLTRGEQQAPAHLAHNPQGLVPVLEIDGLRLAQSLAIIEYLDETRGLRLLPGDPAGRARVRAIAHAIAMDIHPVCNLRVTNHVRQLTGADFVIEDWMARFLGPGLAAVEAMVDDGDFCHGGRLSLADLCLVPQIYNARRWGIDLAPLPRLRRIEAHLAALPAFARAHPDRVKPA
ncbi:maleylacetoacetate isomerase [Paracoccus siganidrum]|uniref:Maleylacetoacetate isomerase n=1 Tax=Paracoccus siganidrum TaxID=1276757 RepID=A0A418ZYN6_9RHOB|nr:maleylacetoacetate isomerase [Paracoccus siganidrum]RJL05658.1 maleylacetoacetate isomerase [Paracoccus siganidrum]RMC29787.1 maleylacetoacetate isomerase [Paracoccus siganidrum]